MIHYLKSSYGRQIILLNLIVIFLFINIQFCSFIIILFALNFLVNLNFKKVLLEGVKNVFFLTNAFFLVFFIISLIYTENFSGGLFEIEKKLTFIVFPLILAVVRLKTEDLYLLFKTFILCCATICSISLILAIKRYTYSQNINYFFLNEILYFTDFHRVYLSFYLLFAIHLIMGIDELELRGGYKFFLISTFTLFILLLASRMIIVLMILSFVYIVMNKVRDRKRVILLLSLFISFVTFFVLLTPIYEMLANLFTNLQNGNVQGKTNGVNLRIIQWNLAFRLILKSIWIGYGPGDFLIVLTNFYKENGFNYGYDNRLNSHNQILDTVLGLGLVGFCSLLAILYVSFKTAIKEYGKLPIYFIFLSIFCLTMISESVLETNKGIIFFTLFNSLLFFNKEANLDGKIK